MSWTSDRDADVLTALAAAVADNSDDPVDEDAFIAEMFPSVAGAGMGERLGRRVLARSLLSRAVKAEDVTRSTAQGRAHYIAS